MNDIACGAIGGKISGFFYLSNHNYKISYMPFTTARPTILIFAVDAYHHNLIIFTVKFEFPKRKKKLS